MKHEQDGKDEDLRPASFPAKVLLAATPFALLALFFLLQMWLSDP